LAQHALGYQPILNTISEISGNDWRNEIIDYLKDTSKRVERRVRFQATKYALLEDELYYRTIDGVLLKCLGCHGTVQIIRAQVQKQSPK